MKLDGKSIVRRLWWKMPEVPMLPEGVACKTAGERTAGKSIAVAK